MPDLARILAWASSTVWAIEPRYGRTVAGVLRRRALGHHYTEQELDAALLEARGNCAAHERSAMVGSSHVGGGVAVIPIVGVIKHRGGDMNDSGTRYAGLQAFAKRFRAVDHDPSIRTIVLDIDSPGGAVDGVAEMAAMIRSASKPVVAVANTMCASAAFWLGSQADVFYASPSAMVGSVGVYMMHVDQSVRLENEGLSVSLISAGPHKVEGNPFEELTQDARNEIQRSVDSTYADFTAGVALGRGTTVARVRDGYGGGRIVLAKDALKAGMIDRIGTLEEAVARSAGGRIRRRRRAEVDGTTTSGEADSAHIEPLTADRERMLAADLDSDGSPEPAPPLAEALDAASSEFASGLDEIEILEREFEVS